MKQTWQQYEVHRERVERQRLEILKRIVGLPKFLESLFICFYSHSERKLGAHLLVEGKVGKGKTATLETFAHTISGAKFSRVQFTPDLKPLDLVRIVEQREDRSLEFSAGPLFANLVLADEINRSHEKTRAALLEAMGERQITIGKSTFPLEEPFFVMATENPIDVEGTFMLGAAQLDRFMMKVYPEDLSEDDELAVAEAHQDKDIAIRPIVSKTEVLETQAFIREHIQIDPLMRRDMVRFVRALRPGAGIVAAEDFYLLPEGERGYLFLERAAKVRAFLHDRDSVVFSDLAALAFPVLNHRIGFRHIAAENERQAKATELFSRAMQKVVEDGARGL